MLNTVAPAYSIASKPKPANRLAMPGPGDYSTKQSFTEESSKFSFARAPRHRQLLPASPGPGSYTSSKSLGTPSKPVSFPRASRLAENARQDRSRHTSLDLIKARAGLVSLGNPGPGSYWVQRDLLPKAPHWTFSSSPKTGWCPASPGPGDYETALTVSSPKHQFGSAPRLSVKPTLTPGPGDYSAKDWRRKSQQALVLSRHTPKVEVTPGPGDYYISSTFGLAGRRAAKSYAIR